jgi:hypothetical protein
LYCGQRLSLRYFCFFEKISGSVRIAIVACLVYMSCSTYVTFNAMFAYESIGTVFIVLVLLVETRVRGAYSTRDFILPAILLACLTVSHHVSSLWCTVYLVGLVVIEAVRRDKESFRTRLGMTGAMAVLAVTMPLLWMTMRGNPFFSYMAPHIESTIKSFYANLSGSQTAHEREMFVGADGKAQPLFNILIGITSTLFLTIGLVTGFYRSFALTVPAEFSGWSRVWQVIRLRYTDSRVVLLTLGAFGFPLSVALRFTDGGWEIGNRMNTFVFIPVGLVVAVSIIYYWQAGRLAKWLTSIVLANILLGGIIIGSGFYLIHSRYMVGADEASIEHMGIGTASWTKTWLGKGNIFAADRVNRVLLSTYGQQQGFSAMTGIRADQTHIFFDSSITAETLHPIRAGNIAYLLIDLRLTTDRAVLGEYYESGETRVSYGNPPVPSSLLKFDGDDKISRPFDNGWMKIYDVRGIRDGR